MFRKCPECAYGYEDSRFDFGDDCPHCNVPLSEGSGTSNRVQSIVENSVAPKNYFYAAGRLGPVTGRSDFSADHYDSSRFSNATDHTLKYIGVAIFVFAIITFLIAKPKVDAINSLNGQLALGLAGFSGNASEVESQIQNYQWAYNLSIVGMVVGGLMIVVGFIKDSQK